MINLYLIYPHQSALYVLLTLCFAIKPVQIKQLQHTLNLSRTTIIKIINTAENWLSDHQLKLIRRPNYGYEINGTKSIIAKRLLAYCKNVPEMPVCWHLLKG